MQLLTGQDNLGETRVLGETEDLSDESITVPIITLSELCEKFNLEHIDGMKVDVEGLEEAVMLPFLKEASDALLPRLVVIEDNTDAWETDILAAAAERGYRLRKKTRMNFLLERN
ncbi:FkbM family methyltransferase [Alphaproteobacteria bacterium]|nr:FkbM family methyltransferase [Alphaproteobacteria bacterium]MDB2523292.1 FkbM family methyltransferase [Alphaproteobacteria bacterium]MDB2641281.1 FkbM family methyltransferase [Alphaproteobacteria bacterium]